MGGTPCGCDGALVQSPRVLDSSLSFKRFPAALQRPLPPTRQYGGGKHLLGGWEQQSPPGPLPRRPRPPGPSRVPPPRPPPAERRVSARRPEERTAARRAHGCRSARRGTPRREASRARGCPRGGRSRGSAVETPGAPGRARLVSAPRGVGSQRVGVETPRSRSPARPVPGSAPAALCSRASSVLVLCVSAPSLRLFFPASVPVSLYLLSHPVSF